MTIAREKLRWLYYSKISLGLWSIKWSLVFPALSPLLHTVLLYWRGFRWGGGSFCLPLAWSFPGHFLLGGARLRLCPGSACGQYRLGAVQSRFCPSSACIVGIDLKILKIFTRTFVTRVRARVVFLVRLWFRAWSRRHCGRRISGVRVRSMFVRSNRCWGHGLCKLWGVWWNERFRNGWGCISRAVFRRKRFTVFLRRALWLLFPAPRTRRGWCAILWFLFGTVPYHVALLAA